MRASDLMEDFPSIDVTASAHDAARLIGRERRVAVIVTDQGRPVTVLPASAVVQVLVPAYLREDSTLVRVYDEKGADACAVNLEGKLVRDLLPPRGRRTDLPVVDAEATLLECAALMARLHVPLLVVSTEEEDGVMIGAISASKILETMVP